MCLKLLRRKNLMRGTTMRRKCCCAASRNMCPVHVLWHGYFAGLGRGCKPWARISAGDARSMLRSTLHNLKVWRGCAPQPLLYIGCLCRSQMRQVSLLTIFAVVMRRRSLVSWLIGFFGYAFPPLAGLAIVRRTVVQNPCCWTMAQCSLSAVFRPV